MTRPVKDIFFIACFLVLYSCEAQTKPNSDNTSNIPMENTELTVETAHPKARKLLSEDFYWSTIEESGPFGNDDGADALYGFKRWRVSNLKTSPVTYLQILINSWEYETFDWNEMRPKKIEDYLEKPTKVDLSGTDVSMMKEHFKKEAEDAGKKFDEEAFNKKFTSVQYAKLGERHLRGIDNAIIAVGFGQYAIEGRIDGDLKKLTNTALKRELLPLLLDKWDESYRKKRQAQLETMLRALEKMEQ